jgi:hypothetical protein
MYACHLPLSLQGLIGNWCLMRDTIAICAMWMLPMRRDG